MSENIIKRSFQAAYGTFNVLQFVEAKQADSKCSKIFRLIALQWYPRSDLQALGTEFFAIVNIGITSVTDDHAGGLETFGGDAWNYTNINFGYDLEAALFGNLWIDKDCDGVQDAGQHSVTFDASELLITLNALVYRAGICPNNQNQK